MKIPISKKKIEKTQDEIIKAFKKTKEGNLITIDDFCDPEMWAESTDFFSYMFNLIMVVRSIISYMIISGDKKIIDKAKLIKGFQNERCNEINNLVFDKLTNRYLDTFMEYCDSTAVLQLLLDGNFDISLLSMASEAFVFYDKVAKGKIDEYSYYEDRLSAEVIRKTILEDFNYVIGQFENSKVHEFIRVDDRMSEQAIKVCYILSKIATNTHEESMPMLADAIMSILKLQWLDQYRKNDFGTGLNKESLFLLQYSFEKIQNKFSGDVFRLLNSFRPERVFENIMKNIKK